MRTTLLLSSLALAAVAGAQATTLSPGAISGYWSSHNSVYSGGSTQLQSALATHSYKYTYTEIGSHGQVLHPTATDVMGWMAEFALPAIPAGMAVESATLSAGVGGGPSQPVFASVYTGDGAVTLPDWTVAALGVTTSTANPNSAFRIDVSSGVRALYASGGGWAGLRVGRSAQVTYVEQSLSWSSPRLILTYAPQAVPEPAPLGALGVLVLLRRRKARS